MDRRKFFGVAAAALATPTFAAEPERHPVGPPVMRRFDDERWLLDNVIQANGMDWDQPHRAVLLGSCGLGVQNDLAALGNRIKKLADFTPAFAAVAERRQGLAEEAEQNGETIPARDHYYI